MITQPLAYPVASGPAIAIEARNLGKIYGPNWALRGVDLDVAEGEAVAVFGANGAGKSTLVRLLATLALPSLGTIRLVGRDAVRSARSVRRTLGVLLHQNYLYPELTAAENLALYAQLYGVRDVAGRVRESLESVELAAVATRRAREMSRGMQQRLALARATIHEPDVLLLDEPDSGLDERGSECLARLLARGRSRGQTVVMATHRLEMGLELCQRALVLARGRGVYLAPTEAHSADEWHALYRGLCANRP